MKKAKIRKILWIFLIMSLLQFLFYWLRGGYITVIGLAGQQLSMVVFFIIYFIAAVWLIRKYRETLPRWIVITTILIGTIWFELALRTYIGRNPLGSLPDYIMRIIGVGMGIWYCYINSKIGKLALVICSAIFALWCSYFGYELWLNKLNQDTFTGRVMEVIESPLIFQDTTGRNIPVSEFKGKYVVLDFWSATCGWCMKEFPEVNKLYEKLKEDDQIVMYTVFCRRASQGETLQDGCEIMKSRGFTIPTLSADIDDPVLKQIGVDRFPTVRILDPNGKIIFRGSLHLAERFIN